MSTRARYNMHGTVCPLLMHNTMRYLHLAVLQVSLKNQFVVAVDQIALKNAAGKSPVSTFQWCTLEEHVPHLAYLAVSPPKCTCTLMR